MRGGVHVQENSRGQEVLDGSSKLLGETGVRHSAALLDKPVSKGRIAETILAQADQWDADRP